MELSDSYGTFISICVVSSREANLFFVEEEFLSLGV